MTKTQAALVAAMGEALATGTWDAIGNNTIRYMETRETPESNQGRGFGRWPEPTYTRLLFVTIIAGKTWSIILGTSRAPWVERNDTRITFKRAFEILADPAGQF